MTAVPPHIYRKNATRKGLAPEVIQRALAQMAEVESRGFPALLTLAHLAHHTGAEYKYLRSIIKRDLGGYRAFTIKKRSGGRRAIASPEPVLYEVQRWIVTNILNRAAAHSASFAYAPGSSPLRCALQHTGADWLIKIDIHDFFESITEKSVYFAFRRFGYQPLISFELARLCTREHDNITELGARWLPNTGPADKMVYKPRHLGHLPQGAPTSPMLANLCNIALDVMLSDFAQGLGLTYTRYSDDLAFSRSGTFSHRQAASVIENVGRILNSFGYQVHARKTSVLPPGARKIVLGLLIDGTSPRLTKEFRARVSDHVRGIEKFGLAAHATNRHFVSVWGMLNHLYGILAYSISIDRAWTAALRDRLNMAVKKEGWRQSTSDVPV